MPTYTFQHFETSCSTETTHVVIHGHPTPQGRPRGRILGGGRAMMFYNPNDSVKRLFQEVASNAISTFDRKQKLPVYTCQVKMEFMFFFKRPLTHFYGKERKAQKLKEDFAVAYPKSGGDIDNILKFCLDALEGVLYINDCSVIKLTAEKKYTNDDDERIDIKCHPIHHV